MQGAYQRKAKRVLLIIRRDIKKLVLLAPRMTLWGERSHFFLNWGCRPQLRKKDKKGVTNQDVIMVVLHPPALISVGRLPPLQFQHLHVVSQGIAGYSEHARCG